MRQGLIKITVSKIIREKLLIKHMFSFEKKEVKSEVTL